MLVLQPDGSVELGAQDCCCGVRRVLVCPSCRPVLMAELLLTRTRVAELAKHFKHELLRL